MPNRLCSFAIGEQATRNIAEHIAYTQAAAVRGQHITHPPLFDTAYYRAPNAQRAGQGESSVTYTLVEARLNQKSARMLAFQPIDHISCRAQHGPHERYRT
ncbi:hypothetical protein ACX0KM_12855 [Pseudomonas promysalinigenes]